jgi:cellobiose-specific phosphotransferase system component IIA
MKINRRFAVATAAAAMTLFSVSFAQAAAHHKMVLTTSSGKQMSFDVVKMHGQDMILVPEHMAPDVFHQMVFRFE